MTTLELACCLRCRNEFVVIQDVLPFSDLIARAKAAGIDLLDPQFVTLFRAVESARCAMLHGSVRDGAPEPICWPPRHEAVV